jgi:hypothetical protein
MVFCDNSSLSALAEMGMLGILPRIVGPVRIPSAVAAEGCHPRAPEALFRGLAEPSAVNRIPTFSSLDG